MTQNALKPIDSFKQELALMEPSFKPLLPKHVPVDKFKALVITAVGSNPKLLECTRASLWKACMTGAELGLSLNPVMGEADILPVWNKNVNGNEAQFRPRYKGLMNLARRSGEVTSIRAELVYANDEFEVTGGLRPDIIHKHAKGDRGALTHAYCVWTLKGVAEPQFEVMDRAQIMRIKARSSSKNKAGEVYGPWVTDEEEMWRKTVVKRATKYMPIELDAFTKAVAVDNLAEGGAEYGVTVDGEIIEAEDITAEAPEQDFAEQAVEMEEEIANEESSIQFLDFGPTDTWLTWTAKAASVLKSLPPGPQRQAWLDVHQVMIDEAEASAPKHVSRLRALVKEGQ